MASVARAILVGIGCVFAWFAAVEGFHRAITEVGGIALADHTLDFCPNWLLGFATGAGFFALMWWAHVTSRG